MDNEDIFKIGNINILHPISELILRYLMDIYQCTAFMSILEKMEVDSKIELQQGYTEITEILSSLSAPNDNNKEEVFNKASYIKKSILFSQYTIESILASIPLLISNNELDVNNLSLDTLYNFISEWFNVSDDVTEEERTIIESEYNTLEKIINEVIDTRDNLNTEDYLSKLQIIFDDYGALVAQAILMDLQINDYINSLGNVSSDVSMYEVYGLNITGDIADFIRLVNSHTILCPCKITIPSDVLDIELGFNELNINVDILDILDNKIDIDIVLKDVDYSDSNFKLALTVDTFIFLYTSKSIDSFVSKIFNLLVTVYSQAKGCVSE